MSRRKFLGTATAASATFALAPAPGEAADAAHGVHVQNPFGSGARGVAAPGANGGALAIPGTLSVGSGAPLGGIGTGFVELRPDGCFHEWQILNAGPWSGNRQGRGATASVASTPPNLRFLLRTARSGGGAPQLRRLYLRSDENDLYSLGYVQDIEFIDYEAWYPMTTLRYRDALLPVRVSATAFSPFMPGKTRDSATPGFHIVFTLENTSKETVQACLLSVLDNPLVSALENAS